MVNFVIYYFNIIFNNDCLNEIAIIIFINCLIKYLLRISIKVNI